MKANRAPRLRQADEAVSSVVAAVLLFALFTTAFALWTLTTLPQWIADREERHMETVKERFDTLKAGLDAVSGTGSTAPVSAPIPLAAEKVALLQRSPATGRLAFVDGLSATASFTSPELFLVGGQAAG
ncbi:MAG TPA: hypothetical protein VI796_04735, partial [Candidatus Thermoplasmatota archaeon]|nr:hypothetical protein [Candidatus Thermoplasmatota archaeon]